MHLKIKNIRCGNGKGLIFALVILLCSSLYSQSIIIHTADGDLEYELSEIESITFSEGVSNDEKELVLKSIPISCLGNYPNPFNPITTISFELTNEQTQQVELIIYNMKGQQVKKLLSDKLSKGEYSYQWNGLNNNNLIVSSGVYYYRLNVAGKMQCKKMILIK